MIHKWMEEWFDTLLYVGLVTGLLLFSLFYWKDAYQNRCAELVLEEFLTDVSVSGKLSLEKLEELWQRIRNIDTAYEIEVAYTGYSLQPCYALLPKARIDRYYMERNRRKEVTFRKFELYVEEDNAEQLQYQTDTNATVMAAVKEYLPLPGEEVTLQVEPVRATQEVYEGEELITVCKVISESGIYYAEAARVSATSSGTVMLEVVVESEAHRVPVEVICYPRVVTCAKGHAVVNTKELIAVWKQSGEVKCPYCAELPELLCCDETLLYKQTGEKLTQEELCLTVIYMDGHTAVITPEDEEWQDNYDENYCGIQPVTVRYRGKEMLLTVISENGVCAKCGKSCSGRCLSDYVAFPYCTDCMSQVLLFSGDVYEEECLIEYGELVKRLDQKGEIIWSEEDLIHVRLLKNKKAKTLLQKKVRRDGNGR